MTARPTAYHADMDGNGGQELHWACTECGHRQSEAGGCGACGDDPMLDLRQSLTREALGDVDSRRRSKRSDMVRYVSVPIGVVVTVGACMIVPGLSMALLKALPFFLGYILTMCAIAAGTMLLLNAAMPFKPRFPYLGDYSQ